MQNAISDIFCFRTFTSFGHIDGGLFEVGHFVYSDLLTSDFPRSDFLRSYFLRSACVMSQDLGSKARDDFLGSQLISPRLEAKKARMWLELGCSSYCEYKA